MKKVIVVFGTRPEAIKMAPIVNLLHKYPDRFQTTICITGQHRGMLDKVLEIFQIKPDYDLNIMKQGQDLFDITSSVLMGMKSVLNIVNPDVVLVHGDTTTSVAAALASFYQKIPVFHVEAGLRTFDMMSPFPEEMNRTLTARLSSYHFTPTSLGKLNLMNEGVGEEKILITGNTVIDALHQISNRINDDFQLSNEIWKGLLKTGYDSRRINDQRRLVLITAHRRENFGVGLFNICLALKTIAEKYVNVDFVFPMHLNPNVRATVKDVFGTNEYPNLFFIEPIDYLSFVFLMKKSFFILTDSGGIQEEAPGLGIPVLVLRETTERQEAVEAGTVKLVGTDCNEICLQMTKLFEDIQHYERMSKANNPYGDGKSALRIVEYLSNVMV